MAWKAEAEGRIASPYLEEEGPSFSLGSPCYSQTHSSKESLFKGWMLMGKEEVGHELLQAMLCILFFGSNPLELLQLQFPNPQVVTNP